MMITDLLTRAFKQRRQAVANEAERDRLVREAKHFVESQIFDDLACRGVNLAIHRLVDADPGDHHTRLGAAIEIRVLLDLQRNLQQYAAIKT